MIETRVLWLRSLAERPAPSSGEWKLLPAFKALRDFRQKMHDRKSSKRKAFKELKSSKIKKARLEAGAATNLSKSELAQTITLPVSQMIVFGNRFKKLKSKKVTPPEQMPSDTQIVRSVLDSMNVVVLNEEAPDQAEEDSNEISVVGVVPGEVVCLASPCNETQTDLPISEEPPKATEVNLNEVPSKATDSSSLSKPGPSGIKVNTKNPLHVPKDKKKPSKLKGKELAGDRETKVGNGKKLTTTVKSAIPQDVLNLPTSTQT